MRALFGIVTPPPAAAISIVLWNLAKVLYESETLSTLRSTVSTLFAEPVGIADPSQYKEEAVEFTL